MIRGEILSDALQILQGVGKTQSSGILFLGQEYLVLGQGKIAHASVGMSFLLYGFRTLPWKWVPCEVISSEGKPVYTALIETLHSRLQYSLPHGR